VIRVVRSFVTVAILLAFALQGAGCSYNVTDQPEEGKAQTRSSVDDSRSTSHSPVSYVTAVFASLLYFPAKVVFAVGGGAISAITYVATLGNTYPSKSIWNAAVDGDYLVTPLMIDGGDRVDFIGD
jgi:hypothetical protein